MSNQEQKQVSLLKVTRDSVMYAEGVKTLTRAEIEKELAEISTFVAELNARKAPDIESIKAYYDAERARAIAEAESFVVTHNAEAEAANSRASLLTALLAELDKQKPANSVPPEVNPNTYHTPHFAPTAATPETPTETAADPSVNPHFRSI